MRLPVFSRARFIRKLKELGSLASATMIVLSVCAVAMASMAGADVKLPAPIKAFFRTPLVERSVQAHIAAQGVQTPETYLASIDMHGWRDKTTRVAEFTIDSARSLERSAEVGKAASVSPAGTMAESLTGRRVLASVTKSAAAALPDSGTATVRIVAVPQGETVGLVVDSVITAAASEAAAVPPAPGSVAPFKPVNVPGRVPAGPAPHINSLSAYYGGPGTKITIDGSAFGSAQGSSYVLCAGTRAPIDSWSDARLVFTVPAGVEEAGYVGVWVAGQSSNGVFFVPFDRPVVTSISPREGAPGAVVTIRGSDFGEAQSHGWVSFAGASGDVISWSDTSIRVVVPRGALAGYTGVVANGLSSNGVLYGPYGLPYISAMSSQRLTQGDTITITGRDFGPEKGWVLIGRPGGSPAARVSAKTWSDSRITFTVPPGVKSGYLGVLRDDLYTSNGWWVNLVPRVLSIPRWWATPGSEIVLTGVGFGTFPGEIPEPDEYRVTVGGTRADVVSWSDTSIRLTVPANAKSGYVGVGTVAACSNGIHMVVESPAKVTGVSPKTAGPGDSVTVTGSGFGASAPVNRVLIGGFSECAVVSWSDTSAVVRVPAGASSGYVGVIKQNVSSNGVWLNVAP